MSEREHTAVQTKNNIAFISDISHQLNTPLAGLKLYCEMEHNASKSEHTEKELELIEKMEKLVYNILKLEKLRGETQSVTLSLMNTGKSTLFNCKIDFAVKGLDSGGSVFVGEIAPGENKSSTGNLRVSEDLLGKTEGEIKITYEDSFGESYEKTAKVSTVIEKKPEKTEDEETEEKKEKQPVVAVSPDRAFGRRRNGLRRDVVHQR